MKEPFAKFIAAELGDVLDRMGEYDAAYRACEAGNRVLERVPSPLHRRRHRRR